jgi:hypothetical protein
MNTTAVKIFIWVDGNNTVNFEAKDGNHVIIAGNTKNTNGFITRINRRLSAAKIGHTGWTNLSHMYMTADGYTI